MIISQKMTEMIDMIDKRDLMDLISIVRQDGIIVAGISKIMTIEISQQESIKTTSKNQITGRITY
jgi:hypothetical protein